MRLLQTQPMVIRKHHQLSEGHLTVLLDDRMRYRTVSQHLAATVCSGMLQSVTIQLSRTCMQLVTHVHYSYLPYQVTPSDTHTLR